MVDVGTFVQHNVFGLGEIISFKNNNTTCSVKFEDIEEVKTFLINAIGTYLQVIV